MSEAARVLIAEDEFLVAMLLEEDLKNAGYDVVGPFPTLSEAREAAAQGGFDVAILDVNMQGEMSFPLAADLLARGVPFVMLSGYGAAVFPENLRSVPRFAKPYETQMLLAEVKRLTGGR